MPAMILTVSVTQLNFVSWLFLIKWSRQQARYSLTSLLSLPYPGSSRKVIANGWWWGTGYLRECMEGHASNGAHPTAGDSLTSIPFLHTSFIISSSSSTFCQVHFLATSVVNGLKTILVPRLRMDAEKEGIWQGRMKEKKVWGEFWEHGS